jgi:hypothetical protein
MSLVITPDKVFYVKGEEKKEVEDIYNYLWVPVEFEGNITLRRLFELVKPVAELWSVVLNENILPLMEEINQPLLNSSKDNILKELEVKQSLEKDYDTNELTSIFDFSGRGKDGSIYAIEFKPLNELADIPVKIKTNLVIYDNRDPNRARWIRDPNFQGHLSFLLIQLYKSIFYELSFFGTPEERNKIFAEIKKAAEETEIKL